MFGIDDMAMATGLGALGQLGGGFISSAGQQSANAANALAQQNMNFQNQMFQQAQNNQNQTFQNNVNVENWALQRETNAQNIVLQRENRDWASGQADKQMAFQQNMSNTQYQRAMADMRAAGLNPLLAYQQGGAGNLAGAMASQAAATAGMTAGNASPPMGTFQGRAYTGNQNTQADIGRGISSMVTSALDSMKTIAGVDAIQQTIAESKTRQPLIEAQTETEKVEKVKKIWEAFKTQKEIPNVEANLDFIRAQTNNTLASAGLTQQEIKNMREFGSKEILNWVERIFRTIGIGMPTNAKQPVMIDGKPLQLPEEAGWLKWLRRQF